LQEGRGFFLLRISDFSDFGLRILKLGQAKSPKRGVILGPLSADPVAQQRGRECAVFHSRSFAFICGQTLSD
jgi:hypothetical protein